MRARGHRFKPYPWGPKVVRRSQPFVGWGDVAIRIESGRAWVTIVLTEIDDGEEARLLSVTLDPSVAEKLAGRLMDDTIRVRTYIDEMTERTKKVRGK